MNLRTALKPGAPPDERNLRDSSLQGIAAALVAFGIWAFFPIYFKLFDQIVSAWEIMLQRVVWSEVFLVGFILVSQRLDRISALFKRPKTILALAGSAVALGGNWVVFIWAVTHQEILQSSLGYYINPLFNVFLGYVFLGERLRPLQRIAVAIAAAGVLISLIGYGDVPWLALMMAGFFGLYGLIRKQVNIDSVTGLTIEVLILSPIAIIWLMIMLLQGEAAFLHSGMYIDLMLIGSGIVTILPLLLFVVAARQLKLATVGLMQYIAPTCHLIIGVILYGEPFTAADAVTFGCIWTGLALYTTDMWRQHHQ